MRIIIILILALFLNGCTISDKLKQLDQGIGNLLDKLSGEEQDKEEKNDNNNDSEKEKNADELSSSMKAKIDKWLEENKLNRYGDLEDTYYIGGTPLFDEATGERIDRYDYIFQKIPDILDKIK